MRNFPILLAYACVVVALIVQLRWQAMDSRHNVMPHPMISAQPSDRIRASEATGLPSVVADTELLRVRRAGNDSRQLIYKGIGSDFAVSVFASGRRYRRVEPAEAWEPVVLGEGKLGYLRRMPKGRASVVWIHGDRRCVAVAHCDASRLIHWVSTAVAAETQG